VPSEPGDAPTPSRRRDAFLYERTLSVVDAFEQVLRVHASKVALVLPGIAGQPDVVLTYAELDRRARAVAEALLEAGAKPGDPIATLLDRSVETIVGFLGVLLAGCAYVPLDPAYPVDRLAFMLADVAAPICLVQSSSLASLPPGVGPGQPTHPLGIDLGFGAGHTGTRALPRPTADDLAYVIFTSGSTGKPKGVMVPHRGVVRLVRENWFTPLDEARVWLQLAPVSFDAATLEIWGPLLQGGTCVIYPACGVPEPSLLGDVIRRHGVTSMWLTASLFNLFIDRTPEVLRPVRELLAGGEALSVAHVRRALALLPETQLVNGYGPTENTTFTTCHRIGRELPTGLASIPIGTPVAHTAVYLLDERRTPVPDGEIGDLYAAGDGLALGYLRRPELTAERFVTWEVPIDGRPTPTRLYATGDRARRLPDGTLEFCGRLDDQVKISGHRIELGEIETTLGECPGVREVVVLAREDAPGQADASPSQGPRDKRLVAYVVGEGVTTPALRAYLEGRLPAYMVPAAFVHLSALPLSPTGKVERSKLPRPGSARPDLEQVYVPPRTALERLLASLWRDALELDAVGVHDRFFELGGTSLAAVRFVARLSEELRVQVPIVAFFDAPTIAAIARVLESDYPEAVRGRIEAPRAAPVHAGGEAGDGPSEKRASGVGAPRAAPVHAGGGAGDSPSENSPALAIVGFAGRFPGAPHVRAFWQNLRAGVDASRPVTREDLERAGRDPHLLEDPDYVARCFVLEEADAFDAAFFGLSPREAELMDPQQRIFLEVAYSALEDAGYDPSRYSGRIGVFGGVGRNPYLLENLTRHPDLDGRLIEHANQIGNERDFPSMHVAFKLDLRGPAVNVQTACSTSGVALHLAGQSLRDGDCDVALVGGAKVLFPTVAGYPYVDGGALAPDGVVRAFDARAGGMVRGSGCGFVVVKTLSRAIADGDAIRAIVRGTAINNDGGSKIGFAAPSVQGQATVIERAQARAGVDPASISYVETHGTGTVLGDPIEVAGLTRAFRRKTDARGFCALGSVKTNIGHLDAGAMAAGLIKTVMALEHGELPPSLHFETPNPAIDFASSPFFVQAQLAPWPRRPGAPRRAGVSSFGLGGTNAHAIVEEAPLRPTVEPEIAPRLLVLSAKTPSALERRREELAAHLAETPGLDLADVAFTLAAGRRKLSARATVVAATPDEAAERLRDDRRFDRAGEGRDLARVVYLFPGGGAQYVGMARGLAGLAPFDDVLARCAELLRPRLGLDVRDLLFGGDASSDPRAMLERPLFALPALFTIEVAVAAVLRAVGVEPAALLGHSMGEYAAAHLAGVFSLDDALSIVTCRGRLFEKLPRGSMLGVPMSPDALAPLLGPSLSIAAINRADQCVASGPVEAILELERRLESLDVEPNRIHIDVAAHSALVEPILDEFHGELRKVSLHPPHLPVVSNVTGTWLTADEACDPRYWVAHLRGTVRFAQGLDTALAEAPAALVEVGPGRTLTTLAKDHPRLRGDGVANGARRVVTSTVRHPQEPADDRTFFLQALGRLWSAGCEVDVAALTPSGRRVSLPTYPFERKRFVLDGRKAEREARDRAAAAASSSARGPAPAAPTPSTASPAPAPAPAPVPTNPPTPRAPMSTRRDRLAAEIAKILGDLSGIDPQKIDARATFLELGFDSLFLTQANGAFRKRFGVRTTVRQLLEKSPSITALAELLDGALAPDAFPASAEPAPVAEPPPAARATAPATGQVEQAVAAQPAPPIAAFEPSSAPAADASAVERILAGQLAVMQAQLAFLRGGAVAAPAAHQAQVPAQAPVDPPKPAPAPVVTRDPAPASSGGDAPGAGSGPAQGAAPPANRESPWAPVEKGAHEGDLDPEQRAHLEALVRRVCDRAPTSKRMTQEHRKHFADPRTVQGFKLQWKDMVFPIVAARTQGSKLWDVDGNEYIDLVNGYGATFLGHNPPFIRDAVKAQLDRGVEIGPQNQLAGKLAELFCEMTGNERAAFCNTGSEAVLAALRLARTVTGKDGIATFSGHYHGIFDEVLVKGSTIGGKARTLPIAPGIPHRHVEHTLVLKYGDMASLDVIRAHADELAIVLVEPIRSRNPDLQPVEFVRALRELTLELGIVLLFDEMVTGFRAHPGGMQALWGVRADLATYGKVVGGGFPIGVVAGKARYMDALDGGFWQYGDASVPEADMTWFAGTFVRHPVAMASAYATLNYLKEQGPTLQERLNERTAAFARRMNRSFQASGAPLWMEHFSSFVVLKFTSFQEYSQLLFYHLHNRGIFTYEGRPAFFTTAHTDEDFDAIARAFDESIDELQRVRLLPGRPREREPRTVPMSEGQQEIWLATRFGKDASLAFNLASTLHLRGRLRTDELRAALAMLTRRHEALRCVPNADGLTQQILPPGEVPLPFTDLSKLDADREPRLLAIKTREVTEEFDLVAGPLFRAQLVKLAEDEHLVILTAHHLIADGWSCGVLCRELGKLYASACTGKPHGLPDAMPYGEWIAAQRGAAGSTERRAAEDYWLSRYGGRPIPVLDLPSDRPRPPVKTFAADRLSLHLDEAFVGELKRMSGKQGATLFAGVLAGFHVLLARLAGQTDLVVGFSLAGQSDVEDRALVGHCVQFLPLRISLDPGASFADHVKMVRGLVFDAFEHKNFTFGTLIKKLHVPRDPSRVPLMSVAFNLDPNSLGIEFHDLACVPGSIPRRYENFDLFFNLVESSAGIEVQCTFNLDLFDRDTIRRRLDQYRTLLAAAVHDATVPCSELPLMSDAERRRVLVEWSASDAYVAPTALVHAAFEEQAQRAPDAVAVRAGSGSALTFRELDQQANRLARYLAGRGASLGRRVAVSCPRTPELLVALLGVLKSGAAFVPIDPSLPTARVQFLLRDAGADILLGHTTLPFRAELGDCTVLTLDEPAATLGEHETTPLGRAVSPESLAYVAYTSGSTGRPKGVMVPHRALAHYLAWAIERYEVAAGTGAPVHSSIGFDLTITALFAPLLVGRTVHLVPDVRDVAALARVLEVPGCFSFAKLTPAHLGILARELSPDAMRTGARALVVGGEQLEAGHVAAFRAHAPRVAIWNEYGPTEATVGCCIHRVDDASPTTGAIPIGRPAPGARLYVVDDRLQPVPVGVHGELLIGGPQVALGYLNQPELTRERFVEDPFQAGGGKLYRTGDLVRFRNDGLLEFLGRADKQVKVRGYRIELGEIEAAVLGSGKGSEVAVVATGAEQESRALAAFFVASERGAEEGAQRDAWKKKWDALYEAGARTVADAGEGAVLDDLVLLRELSDKTHYEAEVKEGLDATFERLSALPLGRVWAIGCGTGAELLRLAPKTGEIHGTDFAEGGIREIERLLRTPTFAPLRNVTVAVRDADDFSGVAPASYDSIVVNSVCQYFPDGAYLRRVLTGAVRAARQGGCVFLGDVQSFSLLEAHHAHDQLERSRGAVEGPKPGELSLEELAGLMRRRVETEDELCVDPTFFDELARELPEIGRVEIRLRRGKLQNETTRFHYDVWLWIGDREPRRDVAFVPWGSDLASVADVRDRLLGDRPTELAVADVPNWRNLRHVGAAEALRDPRRRGETLTDLLQSLPGEDEGIDPEALFALADELPYTVELSLSDVGRPGTFDAVFRRRDAAMTSACPRRVLSAADSDAPFWSRFASEPSKKRAGRALAEELREALRQTLPEYMVPSALVPVARLPLTTHGKVDHAALLALLGDVGTAPTSTAFVAPATPTEKVVAETFGEVLSLPRVSTNDSFFELGGHSLLGIQVIVRLRELLAVPELSLSSLFSTPTAAALARRVDALAYQRPRALSEGDREELSL
jgi:amino acid adenylation domain-containing protein